MEKSFDPIQKYDVVIIGTGFVATYLASQVRKLTELSYCILEPNVQTLPKFQFEKKDSKTIFNEVIANKTAKYLGGIDVWGNAATPITAESYFRDPRTVQWHFLKNKILQNRIPSGFIWRSFSKKWPKIRFAKYRILRHFLHKFNLEKNLYLPSPKATRSWKFQNELLYCQPLLATIESFERNKHGIKLNLSNFHDVNKVQIHASEVIFASGSLMNSYFCMKLTGQQKFGLGNHLSADFGTVTFNRRIFLFGVGQRYGKLSRTFLSFVPKRAEFHPFEPSMEVRLVKIENLAMEMNKKERFIKKLKDIFAEKKYTIRTLIDICPSDLNFVYFPANMPDHPQITFEVNPHYLSYIENSVESFLLIVEGLKGFKNYKPKQDLETADENKVLFSDCGHYYGTIPLDSKTGFASIDQNFNIESYPECFFVGNSVFSEGGHGHPTVLAIRLSEIFWDKFISRGNFS